MKKFVILLLIINFLNMPVLAAALNTSIDEDIRKTYNPSKLEEDLALPALPKIINEGDTKPAKINPSKPVQQYKNYSKVERNYSYIRLKKGTKFKLRLLNTVSDRSQKGTKLTFVSIYPISTTYFTIPSGTIFRGYVINSHGPQFSGNGGLIVLSINSIILNNEVQPISTKVTEANSKMIFSSNIKGKRKYISSMLSSTKPGYNFFKKMMSVTGRLASDSSSLILTPFSIAAGVLVWGGNIFISPALALFYKGGPIYIREGSEIEIKLLQDVFIYS